MNQTNETHQDWWLVKLIHPQWGVRWVANAADCIARRHSHIWIETTPDLNQASVFEYEFAQAIVRQALYLRCRAELIPEPEASWPEKQEKLES